MNIKAYLYSIRDEQTEIKELKDRIAETELSMLPGGMRYDTIKVQTSAHDSLHDSVIKMAEYKDELEAMVKKLYIRKLRTQSMINKLSDSMERQVLNNYFLTTGRITMYQVSEAIGYSERETYNIYSAALAHLEQLCSEMQ